MSGCLECQRQQFESQRRDQIGQDRTGQNGTGPSYRYIAHTHCERCDASADAADAADAVFKIQGPTQLMSIK